MSSFFSLVTLVRKVYPQIDTGGPFIKNLFYYFKNKNTSLVQIWDQLCVVMGSPSPRHSSFPILTRRGNTFIRFTNRKKKNLKKTGTQISRIYYSSFQGNDRLTLLEDLHLYRRERYLITTLATSSTILESCQRYFHKLTPQI